MYEVTWQQSGDGSSLRNITTTETSYIIEGLTPGTSYEIGFGTYCKTNLASISLRSKVIISNVITLNSTIKDMPICKSFFETQTKFRFKQNMPFYSFCRPHTRRYCTCSYNGSGSGSGSACSSILCHKEKKVITLSTTKLQYIRKHRTQCTNFTAPYFTVQYFTVQYFTVQYFTVQYFTVQYFTVQYFTVQYFTVQYFTVQNFTAPRSTALSRKIPPSIICYFYSFHIDIHGFYALL